MMKHLKPLMLEIAHAKERRELTILKEELIEFFEESSYGEEGDMDAFYRAINHEPKEIMRDAESRGEETMKGKDNEALYWNKGIFEFLEDVIDYESQVKFVNKYRQSLFYEEEVEDWKDNKYEVS